MKKTIWAFCLTLTILWLNADAMAQSGSGPEVPRMLDESMIEILEAEMQEDLQPQHRQGRRGLAPDRRGDQGRGAGRTGRPGRGMDRRDQASGPQRFKQGRDQAPRQRGWARRNNRRDTGRSFDGQAHRQWRGPGQQNLRRFDQRWQGPRQMTPRKQQRDGVARRGFGPWADRLAPRMERFNGPGPQAWGRGMRREPAQRFGPQWRFNAPQRFGFDRQNRRSFDARPPMGAPQRFDRQSPRMNRGRGGMDRPFFRMPQFQDRRQGPMQWRGPQHRQPQRRGAEQFNFGPQRFNAPGFDRRRAPDRRGFDDRRPMRRFDNRHRLHMSPRHRELLEPVEPAKIAVPDGDSGLVI